MATTAGHEISGLTGHPKITRARGSRARPRRSCRCPTRFARTTTSSRSTSVRLTPRRTRPSVRRNLDGETSRPATRDRLPAPRVREEEPKTWWKVVPYPTG